MLRWGVVGALCVAGLSLLTLMVGAITADSATLVDLPVFYSLGARPLSLTLRIDPLAGLFLGAVGLLALGGGGALLEALEKSRNPSFTGASFAVALFGVVLFFAADHPLLFFTGFACFSLACLAGLLLDQEGARGRRAALHYLFLSQAAALLLLLVFALLSARTGVFAFAFERWRDAAGRSGANSLFFLLSLLGFGIISGVMPFHTWLIRLSAALPRALGGMVVGLSPALGLYGLLRFSAEMVSVRPPWWGGVLLVVGGGSALWAGIFSLFERELKRVLAYLSSAWAGLAFASLGAGILGVSGEGAVSPLALGATAAIYHGLACAFTMGALFLGADTLEEQTGTGDLDQLGGLQKKMPRTSLAFTLGGLSAALLPPFGGFAAVWFSFHTLFGVLRSGSMLLAPLSIAALALALGLMAFSSVRLLGGALLGRMRSRQGEAARDPGRLASFGPFFLVFWALLLGLLVGPFVEELTFIVEPLFGTLGIPVSAIAIDISSARLSLVSISAGVLLVGALGFGLARRRSVSRRISRRAAPWNDGLPLGERGTPGASSLSQPARVFLGKAALVRATRTVPSDDAPHAPKPVSYEWSFQDRVEGVYQRFSRWFLAPPRKLGFLRPEGLSAYLFYLFVGVIVFFLLFVR